MKVLCSNLSSEIDCSALQFEIDAGYDYKLAAGGGNKNCKGKVSEKFKANVDNVAECSSLYKRKCTDSVLEKYRSNRL